MPINLSSGDFLPFIQFDAKEGQWYAKAPGASERTALENVHFAMDLAHIKTGYAHFPQDGGPPEYAWDRSAVDSSTQAIQPGPDWKRGFEVLIYSNSLIPGTQSKIGLRTWSSNSYYVNGAVARLYDQYEAHAADNKGKLPVVHCTGVKKVRTPKATICEPVLEIVGWADADQAPAIAAYHGSKVQVLPPPAQNGGGNRAPASAVPEGNYVLAPHRGHDTLQSPRRITATAPPRQPPVELELPEDDIPFR